MNTEIWRGTVEGFTVRIMQVDVNDAIVEYQNVADEPIEWEIAEDELASHTYMQAFFDMRQNLVIFLKPLPSK
jgi:hypothetical protein